MKTKRSLASKRYLCDSLTTTEKFVENLSVIMGLGLGLVIMNGWKGGMPGKARSCYY